MSGHVGDGGASPRCPNHGATLILTDTPGIGICPISMCRFGYDASPHGMEMVIGAGGQLERVPKATALDTPEGGVP